MAERVNNSVSQDKYYDLLQTYSEWPVDSNGYYWDDTVSVEYSYIEFAGRPEREHHRRGPFLLENPGDGEERWENTLEDFSCLFRTFAELPPTRQCILDFANSHGMLSRTTADLKMDENTNPKFRCYSYTDGHFGREYYAHLESFYLWKEEIQQMSWATQLWNWLKEEDEKSLQTIFYLAKEGESFGFRPPERKDFKIEEDDEYFEYSVETPYSTEGFYSDWPIPPPPSEQGGDTLYYIFADKEIVEQFSTSKDLLAAASKGIFDVEVGVLLRGQQFGTSGIPYLGAGLTLLRDKINQALDIAVKPSLIWDEETEKLKPYLIPFDLLAALWTEFYLEVSGQKNFKRCEICGRWEDVTNRNKNWTVHAPCAARRRVDKYQAKIKAKSEEEVGETVKKSAKQATSKKSPGKKPTTKKKATTKKATAKKATGKKAARGGAK